MNNTPATPTPATPNATFPTPMNCHIHVQEYKDCCTEMKSASSLQQQSKKVYRIVDCYENIYYVQSSFVPSLDDIRFFSPSQKVIYPVGSQEMTIVSSGELQRSQNHIASLKNLMYSFHNITLHSGKDVICHNLSDSYRELSPILSKALERYSRYVCL